MSAKLVLPNGYSRRMSYIGALSLTVNLEVQAFLKRNLKLLYWRLHRHLLMDQILNRLQEWLTAWEHIWLAMWWAANEIQLGPAALVALATTGAPVCDDEALLYCSRQ